MYQALHPGVCIVTVKDFCLSDDVNFNGHKSVYKDHFLAIVIALEQDRVALLLANGKFGWTVWITCMTKLQQVY